MAAQGIYSTGPRQRTQARNLIANVAPAPSSLRQTVEMYSAEEVVIDGAIAYVRSKFSAHRYFVIVSGGCSCESVNCAHAKKASAYRDAHPQVEETPVKQPSPSQRVKMTPVDSTEKVIETSDGTILVQSRRFLGWAYTVTWNDAQAKYVCSCGNPVCKEHVGVVKEYVSAKYGHGDVERSA